MVDRDIDRRRLIRVGGLVAVGALAGCAGPGEEEEEEEGGEGFAGGEGEGED